MNTNTAVMHRSSGKEKIPVRKGRIKVRLTPGGIAYLCLALSCLMMGINYSNNLIYALAYFLFSFSLVCFWQTRQQVKGVKLNIWQTQAVFSGQAAQWTQQIIKHNGQPSWGLHVHNSEVNKYFLMHLKLGQSKTITYQMEAGKRGLLKPEPVFICSTYPFGLFRVSISTEELPQCIVYPAAKGNLPLPIHVNNDAHRHFDSESLSSLRKYTMGDNLSRISWKALAKTDVLMTKEFDGAEGDSVLWFDFNSIDRTFEERLSQMCTWVLEAERKGLEYGLRLNKDEIKAGKGEVHRNACLKSLALYGIDKSSIENTPTNKNVRRNERQ